MEDEHISKRHNKTLLLYHLVFPLKYRKKCLDEKSGETLKEICIAISERYEIQFLEVGYESDHVHFLIQTIPKLSVSSLVTTIKSITAKELFSKHPEIKKMLWGGKFWTSGYYANTVGLYGNKEVIRKYIENQGKPNEYIKVYTGQLTLFN
jgi:REP element-mobilizing transposase RayT